MHNRLKNIYVSIDKCDVFADIGCDHGYIAKAMIVDKKCNTVIVSDISEKSLSKAKELLKDEIDKGRALAFVSDGFDNLPAVDSALIAGMGGKEIISILKRCEKLPEKLVLQPMKNCDLVRKTVVNIGYKIVSDKMFKDGIMFYNVISLVKGKDRLSEDEIIFGRTNLNSYNADFSEYLKSEIVKTGKYIENGASGTEKERLEKKLELMKKYVDDK
ncbi:MAG: SAM-dependent methyltransferase [Clostridia bacterium]|nr:SAM-dependent methyltransferase [Clostridia bacterium]